MRPRKQPKAKPQHGQKEERGRGSTPGPGQARAQGKEPSGRGKKANETRPLLPISLPPSPTRSVAGIGSGAEAWSLSEPREAGASRSGGPTQASAGAARRHSRFPCGAARAEHACEHESWRLPAASGWRAGHRRGTRLASRMSPPAAPTLPGAVAAASGSCNSIASVRAHDIRTRGCRLHHKRSTLAQLYPGTVLVQLGFRAGWVFELAAVGFSSWLGPIS